MKQTSEYAKIYAVVTQGFLMMVTLAIVGFLIGRFAIKKDQIAVILAVVGGLIGLFIFIRLILKLNLGGDTHK